MDVLLSSTETIVDTFVLIDLFMGDINFIDFFLIESIFQIIDAIGYTDSG